MEHVLRFSAQILYDATKDGITVWVTLSSGEQRFSLWAKVDTGASACLFERSFGEYLGIDIESGTPTTFSTATGPFQAFGHDLTLDVNGLQTDALVYFFADPAIRRNVLGRRGWLDRHRIGIVDHDCALYLASYNS